VSATARPMAVNVSLGMNAGAHDGTSLLEAGFDSVTNKGRDPGFVVVKSAGNERGFGGHARIQAFNGVMPVTWESDATFRFEDYFEVWYSALDTLEFTLVDPAGNVSPVVSPNNRNVTHSQGGNLLQMELVERHVDNGDNRLVIQIAPQSAQIQPGNWTLNVQGTNVRSRDPVVNVWVERDDARAVRFRPEVAEVTLSVPGTADTVITVAACHAAAPLQLTASSSFGPTRDGRAKPDLCAPGNKIIAAQAGSANLGAGTVMTGTSMAAPHVTGALALVLSHRAKQAGAQQYNAQQLRSALIQTTKFSGVHNPGPGHGMLDAEALFNLLK
jgi:subtilisin family serine protease